MAPRRPVLFEGQYALALVTAIVLVGSLASLPGSCWAEGVCLVELLTD